MDEPRRQQIGDGSVEAVLAEVIRDKTSQGDTLILKYHPLSSGRPRWDLIDQGGEVILGSLNKQNLLDIAERAKVIVEDESDV